MTDSEVTVSFADSGKGIPNDLRDKIMDKYFTTKEASKGTGLGLSISRKIVERNKGELSIDIDHPNTCFMLVLPGKSASKAA